MIEILDIDSSIFSSDIKTHVGNNFTGIVRVRHGDIVYLKNGVWHREDGPAITINTKSNISFYWCLSDLCYSFEIWCEMLKKTPEERLLLQIAYGS